MAQDVGAPPAWRNRIVGSGEASPAELVANPLNWRTHPPGQRAALRGALTEVGWVQQVMVNHRTGHVVDGHARLEEAVARDEPTVPVLYVDLSPEEEALVLASLDPIGALATTDDAKLRALLADVTVGDAGLAALLASLAPDAAHVWPDPDVTPALADTTIERGELYALGGHRLMCGDATNADDVGRLLAGATPSLLITDPPYGVSYDQTWREEHARYRGKPHAKWSLGKVTNDDRVDWSEAWALTPSTVAYVWHGGLHVGEAWAGLAAVGFEMRAQIIWAKQVIVYGRGAYHWQHEPCFYAVRHGATADWIGDRKQSTVWQIQNYTGASSKDDGKTIHSTQKPVECMARPMRNHSGDVYDPFVGSGTTIVAAEMAAKRCYAMEIDPRYVALVIARWEAFTGQKAERLDG
jgi:DNA modification methylase